MKNNNTGGIGFCSLLALVFITLKMLGVIPWSWGWVLSPIWIPMILVVVLMVILIILKGGDEHD